MFVGQRLGTVTAMPEVVCSVINLPRIINSMMSKIICPVSRYNLSVYRNNILVYSIRSA